MGLSSLLMPFMLLVITFTPSGPRQSFCLISSPDPLSTAATPSSRKPLTSASSLRLPADVTGAKPRAGSWASTRN